MDSNNNKCFDPKQEEQSMKKTILTLVAILVILLEVNAQGLVKEWESAKNTRPASLLLPAVQVFNMDFDGDGYRDIPTFQDISVGLGSGLMTVTSGKDNSKKWEFPLTGSALNFEKIKLTLIGFFDVHSGNGDENEAIFVQAAREAAIVVVVNQDGVLKIFADGFESGDVTIKGVKDYDNDNNDEILLHNISQGTMELWGKGN